MRSILVVVLLLASTLSLSAQRPWSELSDLEQRAVLSSRRTPEVVRSVMTSDKGIMAIDSATRSQLLRRTLSKTRDPHLEALYVYLYEILRSPDGSMGQSDVRMLKSHSEAMLASWSADKERRKLYNYAYSMGRSGALHGEGSVRSAMRKMAKKRTFERYGELITLFNRSQAIAFESVTAGRRAFEDITPTVKGEYLLLLSSADEYAAAKAEIKPIAPPLAEASTDVERHMRGECMAWARSFHSFVSHNLSRNLTLVRSTTLGGEYLTFVDQSEDSYTVVNEVYILNSGYFVVVDRMAKPQNLILGRVAQRGSVDIVGNIYIDMGRELLDLKCASDNLYLRVKGADGGEEYLRLELQ